jgi:hypothetical protein
MQVQLIFIPVLASQDKSVMDVDRVTANVQAYNFTYAGSSSHIPDADLTIPTSRYDNIMILGHVFGTGDTTLVTRKTSAATREVRYKLSCLLIVGSNNTVIGSCDECLAVRSVLARNESCRWFVSFVKDFARSCVKVLHITLRIDCD